MTVTPVDIVQYCNPRPQTSEMSDVHVCIKKNNEGRMDPERDELEPPSAGTGFKTPGQQCHPIWETGRTITDGDLLVGMGSFQGGGISSPTERVDTRAVITTTTISN